MLVTLGLGALIAGLGGSVISNASKYGTNAQQHAYEMEKQRAQFEYDTKLKEQEFNNSMSLQTQQQEYDKMMSDTENQRKVADMKAAGLNPALAGGGVSETAGTNAAAQAQAPAPQPEKTNARQAEKQAKAEILMTLANAYQTGVLKVATKKIQTMAQTLAKQPKNEKLKNNLKHYIFETYANLK